MLAIFGSFEEDWKLPVHLQSLAVTTLGLEINLPGSAKNLDYCEWLHIGFLRRHLARIMHDSALFCTSMRRARA
jgi:hypothetical protein